MPDVVILSRIQSVATIMFHYLFPPLNIGMGVILAYLDARYVWTRDVIYETAAGFWTHLFAATFAMGVATGIVMESECGTNWAVFRSCGPGSSLSSDSPGAFTAAGIKNDGWSDQVKNMIPSYGKSLIENAELCQRARAETAAALNIDNI